MWLVTAALERFALTTKCSNLEAHTSFPLRAHWPELVTWPQQTQGDQGMPSYHVPEYGEREIFGEHL